MLRQYNDCQRGCKHSVPYPKKLVEDQIRKLNEYLKPGRDSLNLSCLGIQEFIDKCMTSIGQFRQIRKNVEKQESHIEECVRYIKEAQVLREYDFQCRKDPSFLIQSVTEFLNYFESHAQIEVGHCVDKYNLIGEQFL